jgi:hypothetical protein
VQALVVLSVNVVGSWTQVQGWDTPSDMPAQYSSTK